MALVTEQTGVYKNADGLRVVLGTAQAKSSRTGSPTQSGSLKTMEVDINYVNLGAVAANTLVNIVPNACIPAGSLLVSASLTTVVGFTSGGSATLSLGIASQDGTVLDDDGIDAAIAKTAIDAVGETVTCDGALIGTVLATDSYPTVLVGTAAMTAGKAKLILTWMPVGDL